MRFFLRILSALGLLSALICFSLAWSFHHYPTTRQIELQHEAQTVANALKADQENFDRVQNDDTAQNNATNAIRDEDKKFLQQFYANRKNATLKLINGITELDNSRLRQIESETTGIANQRKSAALYNLIGGGIALMMGIFLMLLSNIKTFPVSIQTRNS